MATLTLTSGTLQQASFDKVGDGFKYDELKLSKGSYIAARPYQMNSGTKITADPGAVITLAAGVSESLFPAMIPIFGQVTKTIQDITIENVIFDGNYLKQVVPHGKAFHNFVGLSNCNNLDIHGVTVKNSMGDGARIKDSEGIKFSGNTVLGCGHDGLFTDRCDGVEAWDNTIKVRINSGLRCKGSNNVSFHDNDIQRVPAYTPSTGPLIQVENSRANESTSNVLIKDNYLANAQGPGIWAAGHTATATYAAKGLTIAGNTILNCGQLPAGQDDPSLYHAIGGISCDGWNDVLIEDNYIDGNLGYGICFGSYITASAGTKYKAKVKNNTIKNTKKCYYPDGNPGCGIGNLLPAKYTVELEGNILEGNITDFVGVSQIPPLVTEPIVEPPVSTPDTYEIVLSCSSEEDALTGLEWLKSASIRRV